MSRANPGSLRSELKIQLHRSPGLAGGQKWRPSEARPRKLGFGTSREVSVLRSGQAGPVELVQEQTGNEKTQRAGDPDRGSDRMPGGPTASRPR